MARFLHGVFVALFVTTFALSWAYAFSGMLWPALACNAIATASAVFYATRMRPRRPYRPSRRHMRPGHVCCYLGPVHVPRFVYEAWCSVVDVVRPPPRWRLVEDEPSVPEPIHAASTPCLACPCCPAALCAKAAADPWEGLRDCSIHSPRVDLAAVKDCPCAPINHDTAPKESR